MPPLAKDSAIIELFATDDAGYFIRAWQWGQTPPPIPHRNLDTTDPPPTLRTDRTADTRAELIQLVTAFINTMFDQP